MEKADCWGLLLDFDLLGFDLLGFDLLALNFAGAVPVVGLAVELAAVGLAAFATRADRFDFAVPRVVVFVAAGRSQVRLNRVKGSAAVQSCRKSTKLQLQMSKSVASSVTPLVGNWNLVVAGRPKPTMPLFVLRW